MDGWGIGIFAVGLILYFVTQKKWSIFLFISGVGAGIFIGAVGAYLIMSNTIDTLFK